MTTVAFLGLGAMGLPMARNLIAKGFTVRAWNRTAEKARALEGAQATATPAEAVKGAEFAITMVSDDAALTQVVEGPDGLLGALGKGAVHLSMSTVSPALVARLAERHAAEGQGFVAAPVFGRPDAAAAAELVVVAGGPAELLDRADPLFKALGRVTYRFPKPEQAAYVKLAGNFLIGATVEALGEALALGERGGVDRRALFELLAGTLFGSKVVNGYGARIVARQFTPAGFTVPLARKDFRLVMEAARAGGLTLPIAELVSRRLERLEATGRGAYDLAGISEVIAE
jgi:3-hydroxyisobutyrate dehydrogenase-like beta-hydroxyacid dehydrogenase